MAGAQVGQRLKLGVVLGFMLVLGFICPAPAWAIAPQLEQDILEVIAKHPEAVANSLSSYYQEQTLNQGLDQVKQDIPGFLAGSPTRGNAKPRVWLVEFADFECSFCIQAHQPILDLMDKHPDVSFVFKQLPLPQIHEQAVPAARVAWAAGQQGKFWQAYDQLFSQAELGDGAYQTIARDLRLNMTQFERDRNGVRADQAIATDGVWATRLGVTGTPSFVLLSETGAQLIRGADLAQIESGLQQLAVKQRGDL